ncbi:MAG: lipopolysaccharide biosynthesis protein [Gemmatimonadales bacterium]|nr:lipopolysaccharide biosynthesis protein [Gemmatimonadota bacterium]MCL4214333.1 lipopolysaccharide biosynthesis protein [Gemmatimonadales bacterium]
MKRHGFLRSTAVLMSGTVVAQALAFAFSLLLARLYDDVSFGHYAVFTSTLAILGVLSTGAYDKALIFSASERRYRAVVLVVLVVSAGVAAAVVVFGLLAQLAIGLWGDTATAVGQVLLLATATLCYAWSQLYVYSSLRREAPRDVAVAKVGQSALTGAAQSGFGMLSLVHGLSIGHAVGLLVFPVALRRSLRAAGVRFTRLTQVAARSTARKLSVYPRFVCLNEVLDAVSNQAPLLLIGALFSLGTLGQYGFAMRMLAAPAALVGQAVSQTFLQQIGVGRLSAPETRRLMFRVWGALFLVGILPFGIVFLFGDVIFSTVFGATWVEAGQIAAISAPLLLARFMSSPTSSIVYKLEMQRMQFVFSVAGTVIRTVPVFTALAGATLRQVIIMQTVGEILMILAFNATALRRLQRGSRGARVPGNA